jgi:hypothetical protein
MRSPQGLPSPETPNRVTELLLRSDGSAGLTTLGYEAREAMQDIATALVEHHRPTNVVADPARTKDESPPSS